MKKLLITLAINLLVYLLPLVGRPVAMIDYRMIVVMMAATVMFMTQPAFSIRESKEKQSTDRFSVWAILIAGISSQIVSVVERAYFVSSGEIQNIGTITVVGLLMIVCGLGFRVWSIRTLGRFFTATVQVTSGHRVVKSGPYALVRHPSYLGAMISIVGSSVFLLAPVGVLVAVVGMLVAYRFRIKVEEEVLVQNFGDEYRQFQQEKCALVPCVW